MKNYISFSASTYDNIYAQCDGYVKIEEKNEIFLKIKDLWFEK